MKQVDVALDSIDVTALARMQKSLQPLNTMDKFGNTRLHVIPWTHGSHEAVDTLEWLLEQGLIRHIHDQNKVRVLANIASTQACLAWGNPSYGGRQTQALAHHGIPRVRRRRCALQRAKGDLEVCVGVLRIVPRGPQSLTQR